MIPLNKVQLAHLIAKLGSDQAVATRYQVSRQTIYNLRKRYQIPPAENKKSKRNLVMREKYEHGVSPLHLSLQYNLSLAQVYRILHPTKNLTPQKEERKIITELELEKHIQKKGAAQFSHVYVDATPLRPADLQKLKTQKTSSYLVIHCIDRDEEAYSALYAQLTIVDFVVITRLTEK